MLLRDVWLPLDIIIFINDVVKCTNLLFPTLDVRRLSISCLIFSRGCLIDFQCYHSWEQRYLIFVLLDLILVVIKVVYNHHTPWLWYILVIDRCVNIPSDVQYVYNRSCTSSIYQVVMRLLVYAIYLPKCRLPFNVILSSLFSWSSLYS